MSNDEIAILGSSALDILDGALNELSRGVLPPEILLAVLQSSGVDELVTRLRQGDIDLTSIVKREYSREVTTHYKWCLYMGNDVSLWLNEYKAPTSTGYARSIHNHRYGFASRIVTGDLHQRQFLVEHEDGKLRSIKVDSEWEGVADDAYSIHADAVHQVDRWSEGTTTLLLKAAPERANSQVFDLQTFEVRNVVSMSAMTPLQSQQSGLAIE